MVLPADEDVRDPRGDLVVMRFLACSMACVVFTTLATAQSFPTGPIRIVVPFPPGGGTDIFARAMAQKLNEAWQVPVIVENRSGANGSIGSAFVAKAPPDGHTTLLIPSGFAVNPSIYPKLPFDTLKDFAPVRDRKSVV